MNLLTEALITILILAISFTSFLGVMAQSLEISQRASHLTDALAKVEPFIFEIERGIKSDVASYGGKGKLGNAYHYQIKAADEGLMNTHLDGVFTWRNGKEALNLDMVVSQGPAQ